MPLLTSRIARLAGSCLAAGALALSAPGSAAWAGGPSSHGSTPAGGHSVEGAKRLVNVHMKNSGFSLPKSIHAGFITFRATTSDPQGHALQGFQLHHGVTLGQVTDEFRQATNQSSPAASAAGITALARDITAVGGPTVDPATAVSDTIPLTAGTYWFFDLSVLFNPVPQPLHFHKLRVHGRFDDDMPRHDGTIIQTETKAGPRFIAPSHLNTDSTFLIENHANEIHEAVFQRVKRGTTDAKIQAFFNTHNPAIDPFAEQNMRGVGGMSPGRIQLLHFDPKGGPYALLCFIPDDHSGIPHAFLGMHKVIWLR